MLIPLKSIHPEEIKRIEQHISQALASAAADHENRITKARKAYELFRNVMRENAQRRTEYEVPLVQTKTLQDLARYHEQMFGDRARIWARPKGPVDYRDSAKLSLFMRDRILRGAKLGRASLVWRLRTVLEGKAYIYRPWLKDYFMTPDGLRVRHNGPILVPLRADQIIFPVEKVSSIDSIHQYSWVAHRERLSPSTIWRGEGVRYEGIDRMWDDIMRLSLEPLPANRDSDDLELSDEIEIAEEAATGVASTSPTTPSNSVMVIKWYGGWRFPLNRRADVPLDRYSKREREASEIVVHWVPGLNRVIGIQDMVQMYPDMPNRRPFDEDVYVDDGTPHGFGLFDMSAGRQGEMSAIFQQMIEGIERSIRPTVFYDPAAVSAKLIKNGIGALVPTSNPQGVKQMEIKPNLEGGIVAMQAMQQHDDEATGLNAQGSGRAIQDPRAPKTASGQRMLMDAAERRGSITSWLSRDCYATLFRHLYQMYLMFGSEQEFFRVTEQESGGIFRVNRTVGGAFITKDEMQGRPIGQQQGQDDTTTDEVVQGYDFDIEFAPLQHEQEARKAERMTLFQLDLTNPIVATNPAALRQLTVELHDEFDIPIADLLPEVDEGPKSPQREWAMIQSGREVHTHPRDPHDLHIRQHFRDLEIARAAPDHLRDEPAEERLAAHIADHQRERRAAMVAAELAKRIVSNMAPEIMQLAAGGMNGTGTNAGTGAGAGAGAPAGGGAGSGSPGMPGM